MSINKMSSGNRKKDRHCYVLMPVLLSACAIPISMLFWIVNVAYSILWPDTENSTEGTVYALKNVLINH